MDKEVVMEDKPQVPIKFVVMDSKFPGKCKACGQKFGAGIKIKWAKGYGAQHAVCKEATVPVDFNGPTNVGDFQKVYDLFNLAHKTKQNPQLLIHADGQSVKIRIPKTGMAPGVIAVSHTEFNGGFYGRVKPDGTWTQPLNKKNIKGGDMERIGDLLCQLAMNPISTMARYGKVHGQCCFCGLTLSDDKSGKSVERGYGPTCAKKWGLPWGKGKVTITTTTSSTTNHAF